MIRIILKQIWNERSTNAWIWAELLLVTVALWVVVDYAYVNLRIYFSPLGFDIANTYDLTLNERPMPADASTPADTASAAAYPVGTDCVEVIERLRHHPDVEAVCYSSASQPYSTSNNGESMSQDSLHFWPRKYSVSTDFFKVFHVENADGKTPSGDYSAQEKALLAEGELVVTSDLMKERYPSVEQLLGQVVFASNDTLHPFKISAVVNPIRRSEFETAHSVFFSHFPESMLKKQSMIGFLEVSLRVKPGTAPGFAQRLLDESPTYNYRRCFIQSVWSGDEQRTKYFDWIGSMAAMKNRAFIMLFLMVNIFLGIVGTFWYRTQQRRNEMGLRMALGSSHRRLHSILMGEGLLLLALAAIPAMIACFNIGHADITGVWQIAWGASRFLAGFGITLALMAMMIATGIWYPARQAMKLQPAEALHEE